MKHLFVYVVVILSIVNLKAQPVSDFKSEDIVCLNQNIQITNLSSNFDSLIWDFGRSELDSITNVELSANVTGSNIPTAITYLYDSLDWYAFVSSRNSNSVFRLEYGNSLNNSPTITNLGNISGLLSGPKNIEFVKESGIWYALLANYGNSNLIKLKFDKGLKKLPTATSLGNLGGWNTLRGLELIKIDNNIFVAASGFNNDKVSILDFGMSIQNIPFVINITDLLISGPIGVRLAKDKDEWYAFIASNKNNKLIKASFGDNLNNAPAFIDLFSITRPTEIQLTSEGLSHHLFASTESGAIVQLAWEDKLSSAPSKTKNWGNFGSLSNSFGFDLVYDYSNYYAFSLNYSSKNIHKINFASESWKSLVSAPISYDIIPQKVHYLQSDTFEVVLNVFDEFGNVSIHQDTIVVKNSSAPSISFSTVNSCSELPNTFSAASDNITSISSWDWDFGDSNFSSSGQIVEHQYLTEGSFLVSLEITSDEGCTNSISDSVYIEQPKVPSFNVPTSNLCTNSLLEFENTSDNLMSKLVDFIWHYDESTIDTVKHGNFIYTEGGEQTITLYSNLTGCLDSTKQIISLSNGPYIEFGWTNNCFGDSVSFLNESELNNTTSQWDFGDGSLPNYLVNPKYLYLDTGNYDVELTITDTIVGCKSSIFHSLNVSNEPKVSFDKPSLITENIPHQFNGLDLTYSDDSVIYWVWKVNDDTLSNTQSPTLSFSNSDSIILELGISTKQGCIGVYLDTIFVETAYKPMVSVKISDEICIDERTTITNNTINGQSYFWDLCFESFESSSGFSLIKAVDNASIPEGIEIVHSFGKWFAFVCSRDNNKLFRMDFGNSLENEPELIDLGNPGGFLSAPKDIKFINENKQWYGILANMGSSNLIRYSFGDSLNNLPVGETIGNLDGWSNLRGIDVYQYADSIYVSVSSHNSNKLSIVNFGTSITNNPTSSSIISITNPLISKPMGISLQNDGTSWAGIVCSSANQKALLIEFGKNLHNNPNVYELGSIPGITDCKIIKSGLNYIGIFSSSSKLYKTNFGQDIGIANNPELNQIANVAGMVNVFNFGITKSLGGWELLTVSYSSKNVHRFQFYEDCPIQSTDFEPNNISYTSPGTYAIELTAFSANGNYDTYMDTVVVRDATSPTISFTTENACIDNENTFSASSSDDASITAWNWDFGDGSGTASGQNVHYQFLDTGQFEVKLSIDAVNGCSNASKNLLPIYNPPQAAFSFASGILCSNSPTELTNNTIFYGPDSILNVQWNMNDEAILNESSPSYTFSSGGDKSITLSVGIPGCLSETAEIISITPGPLTGFTIDGSCEYDLFTFTNTSTGDDITGYQWDFGDGYSSSNINTTHQFEAGGTYIASLTASNSLGCNTTLQQVVPVHFTPATNFTNDLACSDNSTTFYDQSTVTNANIINQFWTLSNSSHDYIQQETGPSPSFDLRGEGIYDMELIVESYYGCLDTLVRNDVKVWPSPIADFNYQNTCFGDSTLISQAVYLPTGTEINAINWLIDGKLFSSNEFKYQFLNPGDYDVEMYVRSSNFCTDSISKKVSIVPLPEMDILLSSLCSDQPVTITANSLSVDPITSYSWLINNKPISTNQTFIYDFKNPDDYDISLSVATQNNCLNEISKKVKINPSPISAFEIFPSIGASPLNVAFTDKSSGAQTIKYHFSENNEDISNDKNTNYIYTSLGKDFPHQVATNEFGCSDTSFAEIEVVIPVYDIAISNADIALVNEKLMLTIELKNLGTIILNNPTIKIDIDEKISLEHHLEGQLMPGDIKEFIIDFEVLIKNENINYICFTAPKQLGNYTDENPDNNAACVSFENNFTVMDPYPNPAKSLVDLPLILPTNGSCQIRMISEKGELVFSKEFKNLEAGLNLVKVDLNNYSQGLYLFNFQYNEFETTKKIVIK